MADFSLQVQEYLGSLLPIHLLTGSNTILLGMVAPLTNGTLSDDDGLLGNPDDGVATFNGQPINFVGSGTATPGVEVLGIVLPLGTPKDIVVFEAGGRTYFGYPEGPPNLLSAIAVVVDVEPTSYQVFTPTCFVAGTMIATAKGARAVETLAPGDEVLDIHGDAHVVLWQGGEVLPIPDAWQYEKWRPIRLRAGSVAKGVPDRDLFLSPQHRVWMEGPAVRRVAGVEGAYVHAGHLVNDRTIRVAKGRNTVAYHHILCAAHVTVLAQGLPCETLLLTDAFEIETAYSVAQARAAFPDLAETMQPGALTLPRGQAEDLGRILARQARRRRKPQDAPMRKAA